MKIGIPEGARSAARWPVVSPRWDMRFSWPTRAAPKRSLTSPPKLARRPSRFPKPFAAWTSSSSPSPEKSIRSLPAGLFADTPDHVVVVDTGNYYPRQRDGHIEEIETGLPESKWVAQQLGRPVIKAFNNIYARHLLELGGPRARATALPCLFRVMTRPPRPSS